MMRWCHNARCLPRARRGRDAHGCGLSADEWLLRYPGDASVMAYIGRSGWNSLRAGGAIPDDELLEAVDGSYDAVVAKLPKKDRPQSG